MCVARAVGAAGSWRAAGLVTGVEEDHIEIYEKETAQNVVEEMWSIVRDEGISSLFIGLKERVLYVGLSNGIRLAAYSTSRMDLMLRSFDTL